MKALYLSAPFGRQAEIKALAQRIRRLTSWIVMSSWLDEDPSGEPTAEKAIRDKIEVQASQLLVKFHDTAEAKSSGGKHQEMGVAIGADIPVVIVGAREGVLDYLPEIVWLNNKEDLIRWLISN